MRHFFHDQHFSQMGVNSLWAGMIYFVLKSYFRLSNMRYDICDNAQCSIENFYVYSIIDQIQFPCR